MPRPLPALRKLTKQEIEQLNNAFGASAAHGDTPFYQEIHRLLDIDVRVDLPLGELVNPKMAGWVWGWHMTGHPFVTGPIPQGHQLNAQGIEGLVSIERISLIHALLASEETGLYRIEIFVPKTWDSTKIVTLVRTTKTHRSRSTKLLDTGAWKGNEASDAE